ncbi:procathepsin L-like isoform X2 [Haemaphysalis longicornis]
MCVGAWAQSHEEGDEIDIYGNFGKGWDKFRKLHNKTYSSGDERVYRETVFRKTWNYLKTADQQYQSGNRSYRLGVNYFADMTQEEVIGKCTGYIPPSPKLLAGAPFYAPRFADTDDYVDWRTGGYVTPIKNQGQCGACWAFSAVGAIEAQFFKRNHRQVRFSEQNLMDCAGRQYGNNGCNGGQMAGAFQYVRDAGGLDTEAQYPYRQSTNFQCQYSNSFESRQVRVTGYVRIPPRNERALKDAVAFVGPISIGINASPQSFMFYKSGVYSDPGCDPRGLNHAVLVVGYGFDPRYGPYWLIKNSWGTGWGEGGYMKIAMNRNVCGMAEDPSYPNM